VSYQGPAEDRDRNLSRAYHRRHRQARLDRWHQSSTKQLLSNLQSQRDTPIDAPIVCQAAVSQARYLLASSALGRLLHSCSESLAGSSPMLIVASSRVAPRWCHNILRSSVTGVGCGWTMRWNALRAIARLRHRRMSFFVFPIARSLAA